MRPDKKAKLTLKPTPFVIFHPNTKKIVVQPWAFANNTNSFAECVEYVIKIGGDTDTNACIAGMLAGAYYGFKSIPKQWIDDLIDVEDLILKCEQLYQLRLKLNK